MELAPHLEKLRSDLAAAAAVGGEDVATAARLLGDAVEPALRLVLLDLLTEAADELTGQLGGAIVEVRLHGREPELVASAQVPLTPPPADEPEGDSGQVRITLRLPENLKNRCEAAAAGEGQSLNGWLVSAITGALDPVTNFPFGGGFPGGARAFLSGQFPPGFPFNDRQPRGGSTPGGPGRRVTGFGRA